MLKQIIGLGICTVLSKSPIAEIHCSQSTMSGVPLKKVVDTLQKYAKLSLAATWDNVGLLIEPTDEKNVSRMLLTNDLTENVIQEAIETKVDMVVSYHPLIFTPLKSVTARTWKERVVAKCLENKIAVYSPHTTFDSIAGGVNDWLALAFEKVLATSAPIQPDPQNPEYGMGRLCSLKDKISIEDAVKMVKQHTNLKYVRLARACHTDGFIRSIALCAGSGASVLKDVSTDLYLTGEMFHHDILDAVHRGTNVILTNHSDSERGFLKQFANTLYELLDRSVEIYVSTKDRDPLDTV